jgi:hypothetical protein
MPGCGQFAPWSTAHAQSATTLTVTNCSTDSQLQADVSTANSDNAGDTITFACNGAIPLTNTLTIAGSMILDGSGQTVTLDGQHQRRVLFVNSGVSFTLKTLTIANGSVSGDAGGGIFNFGTLSISNSTFSGNSASDFGGGLWVAEGTVSISGSIVANTRGATALVGSAIKATTWRAAPTVALPARAICRTVTPS